MDGFQIVVAAGPRVGVLVDGWLCEHDRALLCPAAILGGEQDAGDEHGDVGRCGNYATFLCLPPV
jgi:hypothetical protein